MERAVTPARRFTVDEYLAFDLATAGRHEYRDGEVIAMAGTEPDHARIVKHLVRHFDDRPAGSGCTSTETDAARRRVAAGRVGGRGQMP